MQYISAASSLADIAAHQQADYLRAYGVLATGWVTLADLNCTKQTAELVVALHPLMNQSASIRHSNFVK